MKCKSVAQYDKKVRIEKPNGTADAHGHIDLTDADNWQLVISPFCRCVSKGGREFWKVAQINADVSHVWYTQYSRTLAACTTDHRLVFDGHEYEILSVIDVNLDSREVEIQTRRAV